MRNSRLVHRMKYVAKRVWFDRGISGIVAEYRRRSQETALYHELRASEYFDDEWYLHAYRGEIEFPHDLLIDYIRAGIQNGRDPSPYFNTVLYRRENDVPPNLALAHFLRSRLPAAAGAYRSAQELLDRQQAYLAQTETTLTADHRAGAKPFAIYLQCGSGAEWGGWQPGEDEPWHLLVNHYDNTYAGVIPCDVEFVQTGALPGTKFTSFYSVLHKYPQLLEAYEYVLLLDDDILFAPGDVLRLFDIVRRHGWDMAQASLSQDSFYSFDVFANPGRGGWRPVNGVEIMMPVYSRRILGAVRQLIRQSISGWGFDSALSMAAAQHGYRAAVVDDVVARHVKPINAELGMYYQMLHQAGIYPEIEFTHLQKKYGFTKPLFYELPAG